MEELCALPASTIGCDDELELARVPRRLLEAIEQLLDRRILHTIQAPLASRTAHTYSEDTIERCWRFDGGHLASGCSDFRDWFVSIHQGDELDGLYQLDCERECLERIRFPQAVVHYFLVDPAGLASGDEVF
jgi:hypothetical protein